MGVSHQADTFLLSLPAPIPAPCQGCRSYVTVQFAAQEDRHLWPALLALHLCQSSTTVMAYVLLIITLSVLLLSPSRW